MAEVPTDSWHLDKRVPIALIVTLLLQMSVGVWWASRMDTRLYNAERYIESQILRNNKFANDIHTNERNVALVTQQLQTTNANLASLQDEIRITNELMRQMIAEHGEIKGGLRNRSRVLRGPE